MHQPHLFIMIDQQSNFSPLGLKTEFVGEAQSRKDLEKKVMDGEVQLIYISPGMYSQECEVRRMLTSEVYVKNLVALVNEAHVRTLARLAVVAASMI